MASIDFVDHKTVVPTEWIQDVNDFVYGSSIQDTFVATAGQTTFTLTHAPITSASVFVDGLFQTSGVDYAVSGATLAFPTGLAGGEEVSVRYVVRGPVDDDPIIFIPVGTGTDDTSRIQAVYNAIAAGQIVLFEPGTYVMSAVTGTKAALWITSGAKVGATTLPLPGVQFGMFDNQLLVRRDQTTDTDNATLQVQRIATHTGGSSSLVNSAIKGYLYNSSGVTNFEWAGSFEVDNHGTAADASQSVGLSGIVRKRSTGISFGGHFAVLDYVDSASGAGAVGLEVDVQANGTAAANYRVGIDVALVNLDPLGTPPLALTGIRIGDQVGGSGKWKYGLTIGGGDCIDISAIVVGDIDCDSVLSTSGGTYAVAGIDMSSSTFTTGQAIRIPSDAALCLDDTSSIRMVYNSANQYIEFWNASTRMGFIDMAGSDHAL